MLKKGVIIQASSRSEGNTALVVNEIVSFTNFDVIDLNNKHINHFDYDFKNNKDDFKELFKTIVDNYIVIVFATPIYWYTMSGLLKVFFDRISDFLFHEKQLGRKLRGKKMVVVSCGSDNEVFDGFTMPFEKSAEYLGMDYFGHLHTWVMDNGLPKHLTIKTKEFFDNVRTDRCTN